MTLMDPANQYYDAPISASGSSSIPPHQRRTMIPITASLFSACAKLVLPFTNSNANPLHVHPSHLQCPSCSCVLLIDPNPSIGCGFSLSITFYMVLPARRVSLGTITRIRYECQLKWYFVFGMI
jgi:hypothetical protein